MSAGGSISTVGSQQADVPNPLPVSYPSLLTAVMATTAAITAMGIANGTVDVGNDAEEPVPVTSADTFHVVCSNCGGGGGTIPALDRYACTSYYAKVNADSTYSASCRQYIRGTYADPYQASASRVSVTTQWGQYTPQVYSSGVMRGLAFQASGFPDSGHALRLESLNPVCGIHPAVCPIPSTYLVIPPRGSP